MGQATPSATGLPLMLSSQASYVIESGFRAALDLDTYPLSNERAKRSRGKLISRLVACSPRIVVDKQTDRQTDRHTERLFAGPSSPQQ